MAFSRGMSMRFGTVTGGGPLDTTRATRLPESTMVPAFGLTEITSPSATSSENFWVTSLFRPTRARASFAVPIFFPTMSGTGTGSGPFDTTRSTGVAGLTDAPALGVVDTTSPAATLSS